MNIKSKLRKGRTTGQLVLRIIRRRNPGCEGRHTADHHLGPEVQRSLWTGQTGARVRPGEHKLHQEADQVSLEPRIMTERLLQRSVV